MIELIEPNDEDKSECDEIVFIHMNWLWCEGHHCFVDKLYMIN